MKAKILKLVLITAVCLVTQAGRGGELKLYLPREVNIADESICLGGFAILRGSPEDIAKASGVSLGRFSVAGQKITITRRTILSRLSANEIASTDVSFSGANEVVVGRKELIISENDIAANASEFLKKNKTDSSVASYEILRNCRKIVLPAQKGKITFSPRLNKRSSESQVIVDVDVMLDGKKVGDDQVVYSPVYNRRVVVAATDVAQGTVLSSDNIKVETVTSKYPEPKGFNLPVGLVARRNIESGQEIRNTLLTQPKPEILIKRNALVVIKIDTLAILLTAKGTALSEGVFGEMIKVKNIDSNKIIICKVNYDGTVSPAI
ncbi:MAG: flagellar basal body P-ring formation chaperone FlgA [Phycisphaerae bacterium]|nr:flagellar basal body P-ring formation chaperone FlgA [Phycisphaerae bacterium]